MTHTLHPEIIDDIVNSMNHYVDEHMYHALWMKKVLEKHLWPYLLPPSQHLKDETKQCTACLWHKTHSKYTASKGTIEVNCSRCNGTGLETVYDEKPKTYTFEQMEAEYDRWFTNWLLAIGGKKEELKQSTPKIEPHIQKIQWMWPYNEMTVVESKINELIDDNMRLWDYINNKD